MKKTDEGITENPRQFILQHLTLLEDYKAGKSSKHPLLIFNEGDLSAYFQILDVQKKGCIEKETYQQGKTAYTHILRAWD